MPRKATPTIVNKLKRDMAVPCAWSERLDQWESGRVCGFCVARVCRVAPRGAGCITVFVVCVLMMIR